MAKKKWIPGDLKEGAFTAKAKKAGKPVQQYASQVLANPDNYDTKTVKQANLAKTFNRIAKGNKKKK